MCEPVESSPSPTPEPFLKRVPKGTIGRAHHGTKNCHEQHPQRTRFTLAAWLTPISHWKNSSGLKQAPGNTALPAPEAKLQPGRILSSMKKLLPGLRSSGGGPEPRSVSRSDTTQLAVSLSSLSASLARKAKRNLTGKKTKRQPSLEPPGERVTQQMIRPL